MPETQSLGLPLLAPEQAQKHVTHNEALRALDAIVQLAVLDRDLSAPPGAPGDGDRYIVATSATDDWAGHDGEIAAWQDGAWAFYAPQTGWRAWVADEGALLVWTGAAWEDFAALITELQNLALLGIGTTADGTNPLSAKLNNILFTAKYDAEGGDGSLRYKMNKETAADVLSLLLQTGFSGRAEIGLIGDDDLLFKVSPDGSTWYEALRVDKDNGEATLLDALHSLATTGAIVAHDPSADANYNNYKWGFSYSTHPFVGGGIGGEDYTNAVWGMGINWGTSGNSRLDATRAAVGWVLESKYYPGSGSFYQSEAHLQFYDAAGVGHRMLSGALPHTGTTGSIFAIQSDVVNFLKWDGTQKVKLDLANDAFSFVGQLVWSVDTNNYHFLRQKNAANSAYVNLLFLDNLDRVRIEAPVFIFSTPESTTGHLLRVQPSSITTGQTAIAAILPDMTGQAYAFQSTGRSSTGMDIALFNNDATNGTAYSRLQLRTFNASSGDPYVLFNINGVTTYSLGIDNSDSDAFVLSKASTLGSNNRVRIDDNSIQLMLPPKVPSYTVAGVPSASTLGAGSIIYVSNELGGATLAFSDGTNWKRVSDLAIVS